MDRSLARRFGSVLLAVCMAMAIWQPAPAYAARNKILNIAAKEPDTLDPHSSTIGQTQAIVRFLYRGLTRFDIQNGKVTTAEVEPDLAESWTVSDDGTVWTFKLRKGVQFHHSFGELTAEDVKFSFERQLHQGCLVSRGATPHYARYGLSAPRGRAKYLGAESQAGQYALSFGLWRVCPPL